MYKYILLFYCLNAVSCNSELNQKKEADGKAVDENCVSSKVAEVVKKESLLQQTLNMSREEAKAWIEQEQTGNLPKHGLVTFDLDTVYNQHCVLSISCYSEGIGAYLSTWREYLNYDLKKEKVFLVRDFIRNDKMKELIEAANKKLNDEVVKHFDDIPEGEDGRGWAMEIVENSTPQFSEENIDHFFVTENGVTYIYDFDFPHAVQALAPDGGIAFSISEIRPFLKEEGPLSFWLK